ncbi:MAG: protein kinase [Polyangiales bacterium]
MNTSMLEATLVEGPDVNVNVSGVGEVAVQVQARLPEGCCIAGKYTVHGVIGQGGFAVVYDAEHTGLGRRVAIKVLHVGVDTPIGLIERFRREARISAVVHHRHVLEVYDTGALSDGSPFLVMERLRGENLAAHIARGPLPVAQVVELGRQLLLAAAAIHDAGIVHRDIKPENVMLHDAGEGPLSVKLVDFGISKRMRLEPEPKLTSHGALVGTPQYMSPEQIQGEEVDVRTDLYAIGAVLYESLCGRAPHERGNFSELLVAVLNAPVPPLTKQRVDCPDELAEIIHIALARNKRDRYGSSREFLEAIEHFASIARISGGGEMLTGTPLHGPEPVHAPHVSLSERLRDARARAWGSRPVRLSLGAMLVAVQAVGLHAYGAWSADPVLMPSAQATAVDEARLLARLSPQRVVRAPVPRFLPESMTATSVASEPSVAPPAFTPPPFSAAPRPSNVALDPLDVLETTPDVTALAPESAGVALLPSPAPTVAPKPAKPSGAAVNAWLNARAHKQAMKAALAALVRGQLPEAYDRYAEAVRLDARDAEGFRGLGLVAARLGKHGEARSALERYLQLAPLARDAEAIGNRLHALPPP